MAAPPITERHLPHFHRRAPVKEAVRAATTASITISTALNNGDTLDGVTLATGDRVLVKDQSTGSQNGIYTVGATPVRDYDVSTDDPAFGYLVAVREGTTNGDTVWLNTNNSAPTIGSTSLTFSQVGGSSFSLTIKDEGSSLTTAATSIDFVGAGVVASGTTAAKTVTISGAPTGAAGGDLSGTYPNPSVVDDSHNHTLATLPAPASTYAWVVDPGTPTYSGTGPVTVALSAKFGIDGSGNPYYNAAGVTDGEEAALVWDSSTLSYLLRPYYP